MKKLSVLQICTNSGRAGAPKHVTSLARTLKSDVNFTYIFGEYASIAADLRAQHETVSPVNLRLYRAADGVLDGRGPLPAGWRR